VFVVLSGLFLIIYTVSVRFVYSSKNSKKKQYAKKYFQTAPKG